MDPVLPGWVKPLSTVVSHSRVFCRPDPLVHAEGRVAHPVLALLLLQHVLDLRALGDAHVVHLNQMEIFDELGFVEYFCIRVKQQNGGPGYGPAVSITIRISEFSNFPVNR